MICGHGSTLVTCLCIYSTKIRRGRVTQKWTLSTFSPQLSLNVTTVCELPELTGTVRVIVICSLRRFISFPVTNQGLHPQGSRASVQYSHYSVTHTTLASPTPPITYGLAG